MRALDHPLKPALQLVRVTILGASPKITEGIKWNAPSFRVKEYFATVNVYRKARTPDCVLVILHLGAKVRGKGAALPEIDDPAGLLEWLSKDRAAVRFAALKEAKAGQPALRAIVRQWITFL
jgi:hypothetical protein